MTLLCPKLALLGFSLLLPACFWEKSSGGKSSKATKETPMGKVVNQDNTGVERQPNWDAEARLLRTAMLPRLPETMPKDIQQACQEMLEESKRFYLDVERDALQKAAREKEILSTWEEDLKGCVQSTSLEAAVCARIRLGDGDAEFPWILDQCMRAFPRTLSANG